LISSVSSKQTNRNTVIISYNIPPRIYLIYSDLTFSAKNTFSFFARAFFLILVGIRHEKNQTTYPMAFQQFHNYTQNICGEVDEKSHPYWPALYSQCITFQNLSEKKWDGLIACSRETLHAMDGLVR
tara:strand:+ start:176 stop:556 length:381 start_codon:yes stop_codon:yes gene_type:complete